jgi:hypothetical protein
MVAEQIELCATLAMHRMVHHACKTCWMSNADNRLTPSQATTKRVQTATTTTKTNITIFLFDKKLKAGCVVVVPFASLTLTAKSSQKSDKKETFPSFLDDDL